MTGSDWDPASEAVLKRRAEQLAKLPLSPDADTVFESFGGQRTTYFDTSAEAHAIDSAVYKVQILPAGTKTSPNVSPRPARPATWVRS